MATSSGSGSSRGKGRNTGRRGKGILRPRPVTRREKGIGAVADRFSSAAEEAEYQLAEFKDSLLKKTDDDRKKFVKEGLKQLFAETRRIEGQLEELYKQQSVEADAEANLFKRYFEAISDVYYNIKEYPDKVDALGFLYDLRKDIEQLPENKLSVGSKKELYGYIEAIDKKVQDHFSFLGQLKEKFGTSKRKPWEETKLGKAERFLSGATDVSLFALAATPILKRMGKKYSEKKETDPRAERAASRLAQQQKRRLLAPPVALSETPKPGELGGGRRGEGVEAGEGEGPKGGRRKGGKGGAPSFPIPLPVENPLFENLVDILTHHTGLLEQINTANLQLLEVAFLMSGAGKPEDTEKKKSPEYDFLKCICTQTTESTKIAREHLDLIRKRFALEDIRQKETASESKPKEKEKLTVKDKEQEEKSFLGEIFGKLGGFLTDQLRNLATKLLPSLLSFLATPAGIALVGGVVAAVVVGTAIRDWLDSPEEEKKRQELAENVATGKQTRMGAVAEEYKAWEEGTDWKSKAYRAGRTMPFIGAGIAALPGAAAATRIWTAEGYISSEEQKIDVAQRLEAQGFKGDPSKPDGFARDGNNNIIFQDNVQGEGRIKQILRQGPNKENPLSQQLYDSALAAAKQRNIGFREGTKNAMGQWFNNFGDGTPTILHGNEAVVPYNRLNEFTTDLENMLQNSNTDNPVVYELRNIRSELTTIRKVALIQFELLQETFQPTIAATGFTSQNISAPRPSPKADNNYRRDLVNQQNLAELQKIKEAYPQLSEEQISKLIGIPISGAYPGEAVQGGPAHAGTLQLMSALRGMTGDRISKISAFNDTFHRQMFPNSMHTKGLAVDMGLKGQGADVGVMMAAIEQLRKQTGANIKIENHYDVNNPAPSTKPHFHVQFASDEDANKFISAMSDAAAVGRQQTTQSMSEANKMMASHATQPVNNIIYAPQTNSSVMAPSISHDRGTPMEAPIDVPILRYNNRGM